MTTNITIEERPDNITVQVTPDEETITLVVEETVNDVRIEVVESGIIEVPESVELFEAGESMSSGIAVVIENGVAFRFNHLNPSHAGRISGFTVTSGSPGQQVSIRRKGVISDPGYAFLLGPVFARLGQISNSPPTSGIIQSVGVAESSNSFLVQIQSPIIQQ